MRLEKKAAMEADDDFVHVGNAVQDEKAALSRPMSFTRDAEAIPVSLTHNWMESLLQDPKNRLAMTAFTTHSHKEILQSASTLITTPHLFNTLIPIEGSPITNQRQSGRCWLFASTNVFRVALMRRYSLSQLELSQAYLFFWDKLERANWFLEQVVDTASQGLELDSRLVQVMMGDPLSDGGQWDMLFNLVEKYGLVPHEIFPDAWSASSSSGMNQLLCARLRGHALTLRDMVVSASSYTDVAAAVSSAKRTMMREIHSIVALALGAPPEPNTPFDWTYTDSEGKVHTVTTTPRAFARDIDATALSAPTTMKYPAARLTTFSSLARMISLVHDPRHEPLTHLTVDRLGNVVGGRNITYVNVDITTLKAACAAMLKAGLPVFFGSDVGKCSDSKSGVMDLRLIDYALGFGLDNPSSQGKPLPYSGMDKAQRLRTGESAMTHAMVLTGCHVEEVEGAGKRGGGKKDRVVRWKVQNSWGADAGEKGWFVMSDEWMDEFVYQAVVHPDFVSREVRDVLKKEPVVLPLWDPMGALA